MGQRPRDAAPALLEGGPGEDLIDQAEARVERIGQRADRVTAWHFIARGTVDEYLWDLNAEKREIARGALG